MRNRNPRAPRWPLYARGVAFGTASAPNPTIAKDAAATSTPPKQAAKKAKPARSAPKPAAMPKQKSAKRRIQPTRKKQRRPRRETERARERREMEHAIWIRHRPNGYADVAPADAVRWIQDDWAAEVKAREKAIDKYPCPVRATIENDLAQIASKSQKSKR